MAKKYLTMERRAWRTAEERFCSIWYIAESHINSQAQRK